MEKILIVDDDINDRNLLGKIIASADFLFLQAATGREGIDLFKQGDISAVLLDQSLPDINGIEVIKELKKIDSAVPIIMVTAHVDISSAVTAIKLGAYDFIIKPPDFDDLIMTLKRAVEKHELEKEIKILHSVVDSSFEKLLGKSEAAKKIIKEVQEVARSDFSIIIQGETGTGKTTLAKEIHNLSKRSGNPFVKVDIGSLAESLIETELFGHEKGAFTGADRNKKGLLEVGNGGTIFLDEIQNISPLVQAKLLNAVEEKIIYPVGGNKPVSMDIRLITATNTEVEKLVLENKIRKDLYYRLSEFIITLPPLRDRIEDIRFFALKFLEEASDELEKPMEGITDDAMNLLSRCPWPGNIRELKNVIRKAVLCSKQGTIRAEHIKTVTNKEKVTEDATPDLPLKEALKAHEKGLIKRALESANGNKSIAARTLQTSYRNLLTKIAEYQL